MTTAPNTTPNASADGQLEQAGDRWRLRFTRTLAHAPEKVWRALTEPQHLKAWFPDGDAIEGVFARGSVVRFTSPHRPDGGFDGEVIEFDPPRVLEFRWDTNEALRFEIRADGPGSVLTFFDTFDELGKAARDAAGWHVCLDVLALDLDGVQPAWDAGDRWKAVHVEYVKQFGAAATTIGPPTDHPYVQ